MRSAFEIALTHTLWWEKGLVDHPNDPGGRTNKGVTQSLLDKARENYPDENFPARVDDLTDANVRRIYFLEFWQPMHCAELPAPIALAVFDSAVNCGVPRVRKWLQRALRVTPDGWIGPKTLAAARSADVPTVLRELSALRAFHYMLQDSIDDVFGLGWARRLIDTHDKARELAGA